MTSPFLGEIQLFGFDFPPNHWAYCNGALMALRQNTALFSLLGTNYGGDGKTTFALPDLAGRAACEQGAGPGLSSYAIGEQFGDNNVGLISSELPRHSHALTIFAQSNASLKASSPSAGNALTLPRNTSPFLLSTANSQGASFAPNTVGFDGQGLPHENRQPFLAINFCIALDGVFPSFS